MTQNKRFWCLDGYEDKTSPIVDGRFAISNGWLCNKLNELNDENEGLKNDIEIGKNYCEGIETDLGKCADRRILLEKENKELKQQLQDKKIEWIKRNNIFEKKIMEKIKDIEDENKSLKHLINVMLNQIDVEKINTEDVRYSARIIFTYDEFKLIKDIWDS